MKHLTAFLLLLLLTGCTSSGTLVFDDDDAAGDDDDSVAGDDDDATAGDDDDATVGDDDDATAGDDDDDDTGPNNAYDGDYEGGFVFESVGWDGQPWEMCEGDLQFAVASSSLSGNGACGLQLGGGGGGPREVRFTLSGSVSAGGEISGIADVDLSEFGQDPQQPELNGEFGNDGAELWFSMSFSFGGGGGGGGAVPVDMYGWAEED